MNFLELVNMVIEESGVDDEQLTALNFHNARQYGPIYERFKKWVVQAWNDIQEERDEWTWKTGTGIALLRPRLRFYDAISLGGSPVGDAESGETGVKLGLSPPIYTNADQTEGYADIIGQPTLGDTLGGDNSLYANLRMGEPILFPDKASPSASYRFFGWGDYNFTDQQLPLDTDLSDVAHVHQQSLRILPDDISSGGDGMSIPYVPFSDWQLRIPDTSEHPPGTPEYYTQNIQGRFIFNSALDKPYRVKFNYTKRPQKLENYNDIPQGLPVEQHANIAWRALEKYGEYHQRAGVVARARREYMKFKDRQERRETPLFHFDSGVSWGGGR